LIFNPRHKGPLVRAALAIGDYLYYAQYYVVLKLLREISWGELGVRLALVHGSALRSERPRDVDIVVHTDLDPEEVALRVTEAVERAVGVEADVYVFSDVNEVNCFLLLSAVKNGVLLYRDAVGIETLVKAVNLCNDFMISRRKVKYTETLVECVRGRVAGEAT